MKTYSKKYDIIVLNEIKPKNGHTPSLLNLQIPGYTLHTNNLDSDVRGTCIYVTNKFKSAEVKVENHNFEDTVSVEISGRNSKILVSCIYRSGSPHKAVLKDDEMHKLLRSLAASTGYQMKIIVGDFNLNKITWSPDPELPPLLAEDSAEHKFVECIRDTFMHQHITEPTRYREGNRPTCDDLLFSSYENNVSDVTHEAPLGRSDHVSITCTVNADLKSTTTPRSAYNYSKADYHKMKELLRDKDWNSLLENKSVQEISDILDQTYNNLVDECVPKYTFKSSQASKPIWMNLNAFKKMKRKYSGWIRFLNTKQGETYQEYKQKRNESTHESNKARKTFEKKLAKECRKNPKATWRYMKSTNKASSNVPNLKKSDGTFTSTDTEIADTLNQQYYNAFTKENKTNIPNIEMKNLTTPEIKSFVITEADVLKELRNLKPNKSPGIDGMHPNVLKELAEELAKPITVLFQKSAEESELPAHWLQALVTPIFKKGSKTLAENYRPVSLTCILCKVLEKMVVKIIIQHIKENELASLRQHGFTKGKSVTTNLLEVMNIWSEALMHNIPIDVLYLDYQKAFDSVPHLRLMKQVNSFGITGKASKWIQAFLSNRKQKVRVNGAESQWAPVLSGIPQGSILGPILFSLFVNDLPNEVSSLISLFADDTKIHLPLVSENSSDQLQEDLWKLETWAEMMQMRFHPLKCKVMHLGKNNTRKDYFMHTANGDFHKLEKVDVEKDLGVYTDCSLKFSEHCQNKVNSANKTLRYIRHTFKYMDEDMFLLLYKALVRPHVEYATCIWNPYLKYNMDMIERVQRRATKIVPSLKDLSYSDRLKKLNLETLEYRRRRADLLETYRIMNGDHIIDQSCYCSICPGKQMFTPALSSATRGHDRKLQIQEATGIRKHFFSTRVTKAWNNLSQNAVSASSVNSFKNHLSKELLNKFDYKFSY